MFGYYLGQFFANCTRCGFPERKHMGHWDGNICYGEVMEVSVLIIIGESVTGVIFCAQSSYAGIYFCDRMYLSLSRTQACTPPL